MKSLHLTVEGRIWVIVGRGMNGWYTFQLKKVDCEASRDIGSGAGKRLKEKLREIILEG